MRSGSTRLDRVREFNLGNSRNEKNAGLELESILDMDIEGFLSNAAPMISVEQKRIQILA